MSIATVHIASRIPSGYLDVHLEVGVEILALVGHPGAGKSVVLRSIAGVQTPDSGSISINDEPVFSSALEIGLATADRQIGFVPQGGALYPHLSVLENVALPLLKRRGRLPTYNATAEQVAHERAYWTLQVVRAGRVARQRPPELDLEMRIRVALARALVVDPVLLIMDDPLSTLQDAPRHAMRAELADLLAATKVPTLMGTPQLDEAYELADRIALLEDGRILQVAAPHTLLTRPASRRVAEFVRAVNIIPGDVSTATDGTVEVTTSMGRFTAAESDTARFPLVGRVDLVVRPEHVRVLDASESDGFNVVHGVITDELRHGDMIAVAVRPHGIDLPPLQLLIPALRYSELHLAIGSPLRLEIPPEAVHIMARPLDGIRQVGEQPYS